MFASSPKQFIHTFKHSIRTTIVSHQKYLNCHITSSIEIPSLVCKNAKHALCFSSSSTSAWEEMFHQLSTQTSKITQKKKISIRDKLLASHSENEEFILLLNDTTDPRLKRWINIQRYYYKKQKKLAGKYISNDQIKLLNNMNFIWDVREYMWHIRLNELKEFQRKHGHYIVPSSYQYFPKLVSWVKVIRKRKKHQQNDQPNHHNTLPLTEAQITQLDELNFVWEVHDSMWLEKFYELQEFYKMYGHTQVTRSNYTNASLAIWVQHQRSNFKTYQMNRINSSNNNGCHMSERGRGGMTEKKIKLLESIGLIWDVPQSRIIKLNKTSLAKLNS